jgi:hypothetical protein
MDPELFAVAGKFALKALPFIAAAAVGFSAAESYEHKAPWGLQHQAKHARADLKVADDALARATAQLYRDVGSFGLWREALDSCRADQIKARDAAADSVTQDSAFTQSQARTAFRLGLAGCKGAAANATAIHPSGAATVAVPGSSGSPISVVSSLGVRDDGDDLASLIAAGAVAGSGRVSAGTDRAGSPGTPRP